LGDLDRDVLNIINVSSAVLVELKFIIMMMNVGGLAISFLQEFSGGKVCVRLFIQNG
jgi:hypothetical protein